MNITEIIESRMSQLPEGDATKELFFKEKTCCICGKKYIGFGNNPYPVADTNLRDLVGRCCDTCNATVVIPARFKLSTEQ